jgi:capsular polysaccharide transport system permease protein
VYTGVVFPGFIYAYYDGTTGISDLQVKAFRPEDAQTIATALLRYSEDLINQMNARALEAAVAQANQQVQLSEKRVTLAEAKITEFRTRENMVNPSNTSNVMLQLVAQLYSDLANAKAQLSALMSQTPNSPAVAVVNNRIAALEKQIAEEGHKVVGDDGSIAPKISTFDLLTLDREFADRQLAAATSSLEAARLEAERQELYLDRVVEPNLPDYPLYPRRLFNILAVLVTTLLIYGIGWILLTGIREHKAS